MGYDLEGRPAGDDQPLAQTDRAGFKTTVELTLGGQLKSMDQLECSQEIGNPQPIDGGAPIPKV